MSGVPIQRAIDAFVDRTGRVLWVVILERWTKLCFVLFKCCVNLLQRSE